MRVRGLGRLKMTLARIRGQLAPGPIVLLYHRVVNIQRDPHLLAVAPEHFEEHLLALQRHFQTISLGELTKCLARGKHLGSMVAITFDDGYADNSETVLPLLAKHDIPATFYLTSGFVGTTRENLHDDLERLVLLSTHCPSQLSLNVGGRPFNWTMQLQDTGSTIATSIAGWNMESRTNPTPRHRAHRDIFNLLRPLSPVERESVLDQLRAQCGDPGGSRSTHQAMSWDQVRRMARCELIELGAHTVNHPCLSMLSLPEQRMEIRESKQVLEEQIGRSVVSFAYPYGTRRSYTAETVSLLKELGFANACSNFRERIGHRTDLFQLPRFIVRNWDGDEFLRQLRRGRL